MPTHTSSAEQRRIGLWLTIYFAVLLWSAVLPKDRFTWWLEVMPALNVFTKDYLTQNYGAPELVPKRLVVYSAWGRFVAAWSFLEF